MAQSPSWRSYTLLAQHTQDVRDKQPGHVSIHSSPNLSSERRSSDEAFNPDASEAPEKGSSPTILGTTAQQAKRSTLRFVFLWEILSILLSIACVVANFVVLQVLEGKLYTHWRILRISLTPNTLVSIISTAGKSSLLLPVAESISQMKWMYFGQRPQRLSDLQVFDDASRGPLGCVRMLWSIRQDALLAGFGALITILALAIDPFTQQILAYPTELRTMANETATISKATSYDNSYYIQTGTEQQSLMPYIAQFDNALMRGIFASDNEPSYTCTSGACKWPEYTTLAVCSECEDVSQQTRRTAHNASNNDIFTTPGNTFATPNGVKVTNTGWSPYQRLYSGSTPFSLLMSVAQYFKDPGPDGPDGIGVYMGTGGQIANITTFVFELNNTFGSTSGGPNPPPVATQCTLRWCANVHADSRYAGGVLQDSTTTVADLTVRTDQCNLTAYDRPHSQPTVLCPAYSSSRPAPPFEFLNASAVDLSPEIFWINAGLTFRFQEAIVADFDNLRVNDSGSGQTYGRAFYEANGHNVSETMQDIAKSLTKAIREGPNTTTVAGEALLPVVVIEVRWAWFAYSAGLSLLAAILLAIVVFRAFALPEMMWKSSSLALLFHGLDTDIRDGTHLKSLRGMEDTAVGLRMKLQDNGTGGLSFVDDGSKSS